MQKGWTHEGFFLWERTVVLEGEGPSRATSEVPGPRTTAAVRHNRTTERPPVLSTVKNYAIINYRNVEQGAFALCMLCICVHLCRRSRTNMSTSIFLPFLLFSILPLSVPLVLSGGLCWPASCSGMFVSPHTGPGRDVGRGQRPPPHYPLRLSVNSVSMRYTPILLLTTPTQHPLSKTFVH